MEALTRETRDRVARPLRGNLSGETFRNTHFNDLVVDHGTGVAVGTRQLRTNATGGGGTGKFASVPAAAAVQLLAGDGGVERHGGHKKTPQALSAFDNAFQEEQRRAVRMDSELKALRSTKAKEAKRATFAAQQRRAVVSKREMAVTFDLESRAERARKVKEMATGGGLINAPLLRKWNAEKKESDTLRAFETAFSEISRAGGDGGSRGGRGGAGAAVASRLTRPQTTFDDELPFDEGTPGDEDEGFGVGTANDDDASGFGDMFHESAEEARLGDLGLENVLAMARGASSPVLELSERVGQQSSKHSRATKRNEDAPEVLARRGVVGSTMDEIAAVVAAGEFAVRSPRRPYHTDAFDDDENDGDGYSDDDFVGPAGGAGVPGGVSDFVDESQLDRAIAAAAEHGRRAALAAVSPDPSQQAQASANRLTELAKSLDQSQSQEMSNSRSLNLSEDTTGLFSNTFTFDETRASVPVAPSTVPGAPGSTLPGSSSSGDAEAEMRASLAATAAAMDRVTREAEQADANLAEASRRAAVRPRSAWSDDPSSSSVPNPASTSPLPNRVALPTLKPLDAILGALGEQVRELDLAAANAAAAAPESKYTSSSSGDTAAGDAYLDDSALYAAAAAAANNSAPPSSSVAFGDVSTYGGAPSTPTPTSFAEDDASPAGAPNQTPQSTEYGLKPQRDARGGYGGYGAGYGDSYGASHENSAGNVGVYDASYENVGYGTHGVLDVAAVAARIAAAAVADAAPGEAPDATARRVACAMEAALGGAFQTTKSKRIAHASSGSPALCTDATETNPDSSWAQALGALEGEWASSLNLSRAPESEVKTKPKSGFANSPSRYAGVASEEPDAAFAQAEALANQEAEAESFPHEFGKLDLGKGRTKYTIERDDDDEVWSNAGTAGATGTASSGNSNVGSSKGKRGFQREVVTTKAPAVTKPFQTLVSVDGTSLVDLANALDQKSFDDEAEEFDDVFDDDAGFDEETDESVVSFDDGFSSHFATAENNAISQISTESTGYSSETLVSQATNASSAARNAQAKALRLKATEADRKHRAALMAAAAKKKSSAKKKTETPATGKQSAKKTTKPANVFR